MHHRNRNRNHLPLLLVTLTLASSSHSSFPFFTSFSFGCSCSAFAVSPVPSTPTVTMTQRPVAFRNSQTTAASAPFITKPTSQSTSKLHLSTPIGFVNAPLVQSSLVFALCNAVGWSISIFTKSHLHLDLIGTGAFVAAGIIPLIRSTAMVATGRVKLSAAMVALWATKLSSFLFFRVLNTGHDARLDDLLSTTSGASKFFLQF